MFSCAVVEAVLDACLVVNMDAAVARVYAVVCRRQA
jgi:hypothetical protein